MVNVAINGFGRIGRLVFRAGFEKLNIVAINDLTDAPTLAALLRRDSTHGAFPGTVVVEGNDLVVNGKKLKVLAQKDPANLPWRDLGIDVVVESTGFFTSIEGCKKHIDSGAKKVLLSAPPKGEGFKDIVLGVNEGELLPEDIYISNASCTTNCLAPLVKVLHDAFGVVHGSMVTVHSYTADQKLMDAPHKDLRRARSAAVNIVPTTTGAARAVTNVIPALKGKLDGKAIRVPTPDGSITDFSCIVSRDVTEEEVNNAVREAAAKMPSVLEYSEEELVSSDIIGNAHSSIFDSKITKVIDKRLVVVTSWYDNEWGYSNRMVDVIMLMGGQHG